MAAYTAEEGAGALEAPTRVGWGTGGRLEGGHSHAGDAQTACFQQRIWALSTYLFEVTVR